DRCLCWRHRAHPIERAGPRRGKPDSVRQSLIGFNAVQVDGLPERYRPVIAEPNTPLGQMQRIARRPTPRPSRTRPCIGPLIRPVSIAISKMPTIKDYAREEFGRIGAVF